MLFSAARAWQAVQWPQGSPSTGERQFTARASTLAAVVLPDLVAQGFFQAVNDALLDGYHVAQGFRDSKNPYDN